MSGQEIARRTPQQDLVAQIRSDRIRPILEAQLPEDVTFEKFIGALGRAMMENPEIAMWDKTLIAVLRIAEMGLVPDGKEAAIAPFKNTKTNKLEAQAMPMRLGIVKTSARYGWSLRAKAVRDGDTFDWTDEPPWIDHRQARAGIRRGEIIAAYAVARHRDGRREQLVMLAGDIEKRRKMAKQQATWEKWPDEQSEKTVAHALFRKLPLDPADKRVATLLHAEDFTPAEATAALYPRADRALLNPAEEPMGHGVQVDDDPSRLPASASRTPDVAAPERASSAAQDQQAEPADRPPRPTAGSAPGDGTDGYQPVPDEPGPSDFAAPPEADEDPAVVAAKQAAQLVVPIGQWKGRTLAEVLGAGDKGVSWLGYALKNFDDSTGASPNSDPRLRPGEFVEALRAFTRIYAPEQYQQALAEKEAVA